MSSNKSNLLALHSALLCVFKYMAGPPSANRAIISRLATGGLTLATLLSSKNFSSSLFGDGKGHPSNMTTYLSNPQQNPAASVSEVVDPQTGTIVY